MSLSNLPHHVSELEQLYARTLGAGIRSLAITAPSSGCGVTTLASALARRSALAGRRTLLVDFNTHRPALASQFGLHDDLADWALHDGSDVEAISATSQFGLSLLASPQRGALSAESREPHAIARLMSEWMGRYDCVIADTLPVTARNRMNIPPSHLCAACQGTVLVTLANRTSASDLHQAVRILSDAGARLLGNVVNDRLNPGLREELCREAGRLMPIFPRLSRWLEGFFRNSTLLANRP